MKELVFGTILAYTAKNFYRSFPILVLAVFNLYYFLLICAGKFSMVRYEEISIFDKNFLMESYTTIFHRGTIHLHKKNTISFYKKGFTVYCEYFSVLYSEIHNICL